MNKKRANMKWLKLVTVILSIAVLAHTFYSFQSSITGTISGKAIVDNSDETSSKPDFTQRIILSAEWLLVISIFIINLINAKMELKSIDEVIVTPKKTREGISKTDIDSMYEILKEKKRLKLKTLAKYFKVEEKTILEWARVLEEANLLTVHYPTVGDPQIIINEVANTDESKEK